MEERSKLASEPVLSRHSVKGCRDAQGRDLSKERVEKWYMSRKSTVAPLVLLCGGRCRWAERVMRTSAGADRQSFHFSEKLIQSNIRLHLD